MVEAVVRIRGTDVLVREGDLFASRSNWPSSWLMAMLNAGASHVTTVVSVDGKLRSVGVCADAWVDCEGVEWPAGITREPLELFNDATYLNCWHVRPWRPRTVAQNVAMRLCVCAMYEKDCHDGKIYDSWMEFLYSCLGWMPATKNRFHCSEFASYLALQAGAWPAEKTTSVGIVECVRTIGVATKIY